VTTTLITGANKGLGKRAAERLVAVGHKVLLGSRDPERGRAAAEQVGASLVVVDVTSEESVAAAAAQVRDMVGSLDVLVNNAGIVGVRKLPAEVTADDIRLVHETNVLGVVRMVHAFLPLLEASDNPVVLNVSSGMGSVSRVTDPDRVESSFAGLAYQSSKSALNMLTVQYAKAFPAIRFNAVDPGFTATDFNNHRGTQTVDEGTDAIVELASIGPDGPTGGYFDRAGRVPW
jgi:NAD(P)-dependent dehydrogenase (short-subunit alcohol dehydrogenase family)